MLLEWRDDASGWGGYTAWCTADRRDRQRRYVSFLDALTRESAATSSSASSQRWAPPMPPRTDHASSTCPLARREACRRRPGCLDWAPSSTSPTPVGMGRGPARRRGRHPGISSQLDDAQRRPRRDAPRMHNPARRGLRRVTLQHETRAKRRMSEHEIDRTALPIRRPPFGGVTSRTLADSTPDWSQASHVQPPEGAPNVLLVLIDDAGFGNPSTFGGPI